MDSEMRRRLDQIQDKLDALVGRGEAKPKKKASLWKVISISVPIAVAVIGLFGTGWELSLKFLDNRRNRETVGFYTSLAHSLVEKGEYVAAKAYLRHAEELDAKNARVVSTKALIDMTRLIKDAVDDPDVLADVKYYLSLLRLSEEEINYHVGVVAAEQNRLDLAAQHLRRIPPKRRRLSLLARSRLIGRVYLTQLSDPGAEPRVSRSEVVDELARWVKDVHDFEDDRGLGANLRQQAEIFASVLLVGLSAEELARLQAAFGGLKAPDPELLRAIENQLAVVGTDAAASLQTEEAVLRNLNAVRQKMSASSPYQQQLENAVAQYSAQIEVEQAEYATPAHAELEQRRLEARRLGRTGQHKQAEQRFLDIVSTYQSQNLAPDGTLYKTYFNLALLQEYKLRDTKAARLYYEQAERLANKLGLNDPSIHNTFGFYYYNLGVRTRDPGEKLRYLRLAEQKLRAALAIDPDYAKSRRTLSAVETLLQEVGARAPSDEPVAGEVRR